MEGGGGGRREEERKYLWNTEKVEVKEVGDD